MEGVWEVVAKPRATPGLMISQSVIFSWKNSVLDFGQGEFAHGEMHGHGIMTEADGTKKELQSGSRPGTAHTEAVWQYGIY